MSELKQKQIFSEKALCTKLHALLLLRSASIALPPCPTPPSPLLFQPNPLASGFGSPRPMLSSLLARSGSTPYLTGHLPTIHDEQDLWECKKKSPEMLI